MKCINKSHPDYIALLDNNPYPIPLLDAKISIWQDQNDTDEFPSLEQLAQPIGDSKIRYAFKTSTAIINKLDKVKQWYKSLGNTDKFWNKVQQDLQIPKEQVVLVKESEGNTIEEKLLDFVANYSYTVEINTAKGKSRIDFYEGYEEVGDETTPTQHYSNLTVPGGTNYTENEISTPVITPSIKGHAQFSTDNGIGWFRSDDAQTKDDLQRELYTQDFTFEELLQRGEIKQVPCG